MEEPVQFLELIRQKEAETTRRLADARRLAAAEIETAEQQAKALPLRSVNEGHRAAETQQKALLDKADEEAAVILSQARAKAESWHKLSQVQTETAVSRIVSLIIGDGQTNQGNHS